MLNLVLGFGRKYLFEIIATVCFALAIGVVMYKAQNWCNHACRDAQVQLKEVKAELDACKVKAEQEMTFYFQQREAWKKQVEEQTRAIDEAKAEKDEIVEQGRRSFDQIFKENKKNEKKSKERIAVEIRPTDVVTAPIALVREYNAAVAASPAATRSGSGGSVGLPEDSLRVAGEVATFDALAVASAVIDNVHKYNQLALRCDTLVDIVKELEARYGTNPSRPVGKVVQSGGDVLDGAVRDRIF